MQTEINYTEIEAKLQKDFKLLNLKLTFGFDLKTNCPTAKAMPINPGKRIKPIFYNRFYTEEAMCDFLEVKYEVLWNEAVKKNQKDANYKIAQMNFVNPFKVGQVLYSSWGYEQTNIDFYQIIDVKGKSIIMRQLHGDLKVSDHNSMSGRVTPVLNSFCGAEIKKIVQLSKFDLKPYIRLNSFSWLDIYDFRDGGLSCSWYA